MSVAESFNPAVFAYRLQRDMDEVLEILHQLRAEITTRGPSQAPKRIN